MKLTRETSFNLGFEYDLHILWCRTAIPKEPKAFDPTYETHHERLFRGMDELKKRFPNAIGGTHPDDNCDVCKAIK